MMNKILSLFLVVAVLALSAPNTYASDPVVNQVCPDGTTSCQLQHMGDVDNSSAADGTQSTSSNSGTSSVSNDSGMNNSGSYDNSSQNSSNTSGEINGTITGGNTESNATASGNSTDVVTTNWAHNEGNRSDINSEIGQSNTGTVGDTSSYSDGNDLSNAVNEGDVGNNSGNSNIGDTSATGGSVGDVGNNSGNSTNTNIQGQTTSVGDTNASIGDGAGSSTIGDVGSNSNATVGNTSATGGSVGDTASRSDSVSNSGGNALSNGSSSVSDASNTGGNSNVTVDAADRSSTSTSYVSNNKTLLLPTIQTAAPALVANPNLVIDRGVCGPRMEKVSERVNGTYVGLIKKSTIELGKDDELVPAAEPYRYWTAPNGAQHVFGHQIVTAWAQDSISASRAIGGAGNNSNLAGGQLGLSSASGMTRTTARVQLQECEIVQEARVVPILVEVPRKKGGG